MAETPSNNANGRPGGTGNKNPVGTGNRQAVGTGSRKPVGTASYRPSGGGGGRMVLLLMIMALAVIVGAGLAFKDELFGPAKPPVQPNPTVKPPPVVTKPPDNGSTKPPVGPVVKPPPVVDPVPVKPPDPPPTVDNPLAEKAIADGNALLAQINYDGALKAFGQVGTMKVSPEISKKAERLARKADTFCKLTKDIKVRADARQAISVVELANGRKVRGVVTKKADGGCTILVGGSSGGQMTYEFSAGDIRSIEEIDPAARRAELVELLNTKMSRIGDAGAPAQIFEVATFATENGLANEAYRIMEKAWDRAETSGKDLFALVAEDLAFKEFSRAQWSESIGQEMIARRGYEKIRDNPLYKDTSFYAAASKLLGFMVEKNEKKLESTYTIKDTEKSKPPEEHGTSTTPVPGAPPPVISVKSITSKVDLSSADKLFKEGIEYMVAGRPGSPNSNQNLNQAVKRFAAALESYDKASQSDKDNHMLESRILECNRNIYSCKKMMTL